MHKYKLKTQMSNVKTTAKNQKTGLEIKNKKF